MAVLTADLELESRGVKMITAFACVTGVTIYKGSLVNVVIASGLVQAASDTAAHVCVGIAAENVTVATALQFIRVYTTGQFKLIGVSLEQADVGQLVDVTDSGAITDTDTNAVTAGQLVEFISATLGWVDIARNAYVAAS